MLFSQQKVVICERCFGHNIQFFFFYLFICLFLLYKGIYKFIALVQENLFLFQFFIITKMFDGNTLKMKAVSLFKAIKNKSNVSSCFSIELDWVSTLVFHARFSRAQSGAKLNYAPEKLVAIKLNLSRSAFQSQRKNSGTKTAYRGPLYIDFKLFLQN